MVDAVVEVVGAEDEGQEGPKHRQDLLGLPGQPQNIQTCLQVTGTGATCTENMAEALSSALSQPHVPGRTSSPPNLQNEIQTRLPVIQLLYETRCTTTRRKCQKYTLYVTMK